MIIEAFLPWNFTGRDFRNLLNQLVLDFQAALDEGFAANFFVTPRLLRILSEKLSTASGAISPDEYCLVRVLRNESFDSDIRFCSYQ